MGPIQPEQIIINEIAWSGTLASAFDEWIELHNPNDFAIPLDGWRLTDGGDIDFLLVGFINPLGYYLLERTDDTTISSLNADQIYTGSLRNSGEVLHLYSASGALVDTANPGDTANPNDNVDEYRIYYRKNSENYDPDRYLQVVVVVNLCDDNGCSWRWDPQDVSEEYCFFMTAVEYVDGKPFESDRSNTAGRGSSCVQIILDPPNDGKSGGGGGGGGGCFLKAIFSIFGFSPN